VLDVLLRAYGLTTRERQVAVQAAAGESTKTIAATLQLSRWTVQDHLKNVFDKAGVRTRAELAALTAARGAATVALSYKRSATNRLIGDPRCPRRC
jgi:DNA-binding CsgD family transcriptional regulator